MAAEGRDASTFPIELTIPWGLGPDTWERLADQAREADIGHICVNTMSAGTAWAGLPAPDLPDVAAHIDALEQFIRTVS